MAEFCNLSEPQFRKVFKAVIGMPPKNYIDRLKVQQAAETLSSGNMKISEISKKFGYLDPFHFSRRFKEITGMAPENYRENMNRNQA
jgi:AraC-like DNA-binding protein